MYPQNYQRDSKQPKKSNTVKKIQSHQKQTQNDAKREKRIKKPHRVKTLPKRYKSEAQDHKEKLNTTLKSHKETLKDSRDRI